MGRYTRVDEALPLSVSLAEDVIALAAVLREIANTPEPMNNKGAAQAQCRWLKERAREAIGE